MTMTCTSLLWRFLTTCRSQMATSIITLGYDRNFLDVDGSPDAAGRTLWACGCTLNSQIPQDMRLVAKDIFDQGLPWVLKSQLLSGFNSATIAGLYEYYQAYPDKSLKDTAEKLGETLIQHFHDQSKPDWHWFEPYLTYDNARLTQALFLAYLMVKKPEFLGGSRGNDGFSSKNADSGWRFCAHWK